MLNLKKSLWYLSLMIPILLSGCASNVTPASQYSGFLGDYSGLQETTTVSGKKVLRWTAPGFSLKKYDNIVWNPVTYYPVAKPTQQISQSMLDSLLDKTNLRIKSAFAEKKPLVTTAGARSLVFRGAITGVSSEKEGLQFYEVIPVALVIAGTQMATGHRTMETHLYLEGEFIDAATQKVVMKVVRMGEGKSVRNENTPLTEADLQSVLNDMANDIIHY